MGAYVVKGTTDDTTTLVDLAVVDPKTRSLVLRAGGTDTRHQTSTFVDMQRTVRASSTAGFDAATNQMITHLDTALTVFESEHSGKANVHVVARNAPAGGGGGGSSTGWDLVGLLALALAGSLRVQGEAPAASSGELPSRYGLAGKLSPMNRPNLADRHAA